MEELAALQAEFLETWPVERLERMTLEEYTNLNLNSFTYWIEQRTRRLGSVKGGSSLKFMVYRRKKESDVPPKSSWKTDVEYAWHGKLGATPQEAFHVVHTEVLQLVRAGIADDLEAVERSSFFGDAVKWKLAAIYNPEVFFPVFKLKFANELLALLQPMGAQPVKVASLLEAQTQFRSLKPPELPMQAFMHELFERHANQASEVFEGASRELIDAHPELDLLDVRMGAVWLAELSKSEWLEALEIGGQLADRLGAEPDDPRVVFSLRDDVGTQRLAVLVGKSHLFSIGLVDGAPGLRFLYPAGRDLPEGGKLDAFQPADKTQVMVHMPSGAWSNVPGCLLDVLAEAQKEWQRTEASPYRSAHRPFLREVFCDEDARQSFAEWAAAPLGQKLVETYKRLLAVRGIADEHYKWQAFAEFKLNWDLNALDFSTMQQVMKFDNLIYQSANSFWKALWSEPENARAYFARFLNEDLPIPQRLKAAKEESAAIIQAYNPKWTDAGQDERTASMIWSALDLERHAPYKYSFYSKYCKLLGVKEGKRFEKYVHYRELLQDFIAEWVAPDSELLAAHQRSLGGADVLADPRHHLLAQNIWYKVFDQVWEGAKQEEQPAEAASFLADSFLEAGQIQSILTALHRKKNVILQGPPGTGKTFIAKRFAHEMMGERDPARIELVQFHQSYSYEDFIQGYRPRSKGGFELRNGVFHRFCGRAREDLDRPYFFIIDEINRGNLSKIFGELMMLIEADKRDEEVQLTYSAEGERFSIPPNVHLIGTMNTADRSLAMVDYALRRRFAFFDMPPQFNEKFRAHLVDQGVAPAFVDDLMERLKALNAEISGDPNLGKGFEIGHSYFCGGLLEGSDAHDWFRAIIQNEVAPQLREFWFDDLNKAESQIERLTKTA